MSSLATSWPQLSFRKKRTSLKLENETHSTTYIPDVIWRLCIWRWECGVPCSAYKANRFLSWKWQQLSPRSALCNNGLFSGAQQQALFIRLRQYNIGVCVWIHNYTTWLYKIFTHLSWKELQNPERISSLTISMAHNPNVQLFSFSISASWTLQILQ